MTMHEPSDDLVVLRTAPTLFEAKLIVAVLADAEIDATARDHAMDAFGFSLSTAANGIPVLVRAGDLDRARSELERRWRESVDIDWDQLDPGEREDDLPFHAPGRIPPLARIAIVVTAFAVALACLAMASSVFW